MAISDLPQNSIKFEQEKKLSSRQASMEDSEINSFVEVYYGGASVSVPFLWESQPGTPKVNLSEKQLPSLTPPPSFHYYSTRKPTKKHPKPTIIHAILSKLLPRKTSRTLSRSLSPLSSSSSLFSMSSSWSSLSFVPSSRFPPNVPRKFRLSSPGSSFHSRIDDEDEGGSPVSTL